MEPIFIISVVVLLVLAVSGLVVGVSNDAINFLNSALGSKVAPRRVIMTIASVGLIVGALTSSGMMEVARSGVFHPEMFDFHDVMMLFLGVMFANVILLDIFNTAGLPTSTTVSLVFGLLGSAIAVAMVKVWGGEATAQLGQYINSGNALKILSGILVSVVVAFFFGTLIMWVTRLIFTFRYHALFRRFGALWCGVAMTAIVYFALFKGLKGTGLISKEALDWIGANMGLFLLFTWAAASAVMMLLQLARVNILRITILAGTFSLALAFAGNDLVNFIGVPMAGYDSYKIVAASGDTTMMMGALSQPVKTNFLFLTIAGLIMVVTLWTSKKAQSVSETEINLAKQDAGAERFGSTLMSRALVRVALNLNKTFATVTPNSIVRAVNKRFVPLKLDEKEQAPFDMIRATVNLTVASLLITMGTSLQLPLSTTYVTFMVAMGTSLADRAWGRESAVYRITGVLTVISGWFITALIAFVLAFGISVGLMYGGAAAVVGMTLLAVFLIVQSSLLHNRRVKKQEVVVEQSQGDFSLEDSPQEIVAKCVAVVRSTMLRVTNIYERTLEGVYDENRKGLRRAMRESNEIYHEAHDRKYHLVPTLQSLDNYTYAGHYYVQVVDYISEMTKALVHITRPCWEHIDNNHEGLAKDQVEDLQGIGRQVDEIFDRVNDMLRDGDFDHLDQILDLRDKLFEGIAEAMTRQLRRIKHHSTSTKTSMLYLTILNETKNMVLQSRNLVKSQKYFIENCEDIDSLN